MNTDENSQAQTRKGYIIVFLRIPGFSKLEKEERLCAPLIPRMIEETIERVLIENNLLTPWLLPSPFAAVAKQKAMLAAREQVAKREEEVKLAAAKVSPYAQALTDSRIRLGQDVNKRLCHPSSYCFHSVGDYVVFIFKTPDVERGLEKIRDEIKRLGFLELAEIGQLDLAKDACLVYHPFGALNPVMVDKPDVINPLIKMLKDWEQAWQ